MNGGSLIRRTGSLARTLGTFDVGADDHVTFVAGCGRSGTSWLGRVLAHDARAREIFEPFDPRRLRNVSSFSRREYVRHSESRPDLRRAWAEILAGNVRTRWTDGQSRPGVFTHRVVKEIRSCLSLGWLAREFPELRIVFIVRDPYANAASRMRLGWDDSLWVFDPRPLVRDYPGMGSVSGTLETALARQIRIWAVDNAVALSQLAPGRASIVFYEDLVRPSSPTLSDLRRSLRPSADRLRTSLAARAEESTDHRALAGQIHGGAAVEEAERVLDAFGLSDLYSAGPRPDRLDALVGSFLVDA